MLIAIIIRWSISRKSLCSGYVLFCMNWTEFWRIETNALNVSFIILKVQELYRWDFDNWTKNDDISNAELIVEQD